MWETVFKVAGIAFVAWVFGYAYGARRPEPVPEPFEPGRYEYSEAFDTSSVIAGVEFVTLRMGHRCADFFLIHDARKDGAMNEIIDAYLTGVADAKKQASFEWVVDDLRAACIEDPTKTLHDLVFEGCGEEDPLCLFQ